ncbi:hypothetical protein B0J14DRAFT_697335 [Halenospora varia]|nr:hypothetical protein B0J14DRAFT_697335 [Halenospora varia]
MFSLIKFSFLALFTTITALSLPRAPESKHQQYFLKTLVLTGDASKNNLGIGAYHVTGPLNDAVQGKDSSPILKGYFDEQHMSQVFIHYENATYVFGMSLFPIEDPYSDWAKVQLNVGNGDSGFSLMDKGLVHPHVVAWLAYDWNKHGAQLFWADRSVDG